MDWFQIEKGAWKGCMSSPCLLMCRFHQQNAALHESQARIKIAGRNISNLRYADDTTLMAESEEKLKSLLIRVKEESGKAGLKLNIRKTKIMASGPITLWQIEGGKSGESDRFYFLGLQNHCEQWPQPWNQKMLVPWKESYEKPRECVKKQRHHLAHEAPSSHSYGFPVVMHRWERAGP